MAFTVLEQSCPTHHKILGQVFIFCFMLNVLREIGAHQADLIL